MRRGAKQQDDAVVSSGKVGSVGRVTVDECGNVLCSKDRTQSYAQGKARKNMYWSEKLQCYMLKSDGRLSGKLYVTKINKEGS